MSKTEYKFDRSKTPTKWNKRCNCDGSDNENRWTNTRFFYSVFLKCTFLVRRTSNVWTNIKSDEKELHNAPKTDQKTIKNVIMKRTRFWTPKWPQNELQNGSKRVSKCDRIWSKAPRESQGLQKRLHGTPKDIKRRPKERFRRQKEPTTNPKEDPRRDLDRK